MAKSVILDVLEHTIGKYVLNLDASALNVAVWKGNIELHSLKLDVNAVNSELAKQAADAPNLAVPFRVVSGSFDSLEVEVPWTKLSSRAVVFRAKSLHVQLEPFDFLSGRCHKQQDEGNSTDTLDLNVGTQRAKKSPRESALYEAEQSRQRANALKSLAAQDGESDGKGKENFGAKLIRRIIENLQVEITDVKIELRGSKCCTGVVLRSLSLVSTDEDGNPTFVDRVKEKSNFLHKFLHISGFGIFCDDNEMAQVYNSSGRISSSVTHDYILSPLSFESKLRQSDLDRCVDFPKYLLSTKLSEVSVMVSKMQAEFLKDLGSEVEQVKSTPRLLFPEYRPILPISKSTAKEWWKYATRCIGRLNRRRSWVEFYLAFRKRQQYIALYKRFANHIDCDWMTPLSRAEVKEMLAIENDCSISVDGIMKWRDLADAQVNLEKTKHIANKESRKKSKGAFSSFFKSKSPDELEGEDDAPISLSIEELRELEVSLQESPETKLSSDSKLAIVDFTLASFGVDLIGRGMRPLAKYALGKVSADFLANQDGSFAFGLQLQSVALHDLVTHQTKFPTILKSLQSTSNALDFKLKKSRSGDQNLFMNLVAFEIVASPQFVVEVMEFAKFESSAKAEVKVLDDDNDDVGGGPERQIVMEGAADKLSLAIADAWSHKKSTKQVWQVDCNIKAPIFVVPENCIDAQATALILDMGSFRFLYGAPPAASVRDWFQANSKAAFDPDYVDYLALEMNHLAFYVGTVGEYISASRKGQITRSGTAIIEPIFLSIDCGIDNSTVELSRTCIMSVLPDLNLQLALEQVARIMSVGLSWSKLFRKSGAESHIQHEINAEKSLASTIPSKNKAKKGAIETQKSVQSHISADKAVIFFHAIFSLQKFGVTITDGGDTIEANLVSVVASTSSSTDGSSSSCLRMGWFWILDRLNGDYIRNQRLLVHSDLPKSSSWYAENDYKIIEELEEDGIFEDSYLGSSGLADIFLTQSPEIVGVSAKTTTIEAKLSSLFVHWNPHAIQSLLMVNSRIMEKVKGGVTAMSGSKKGVSDVELSIALPTPVEKLEDATRSLEDAPSRLVLKAKLGTIAFALNSAKDDLPLCILTMAKTDLNVDMMKDDLQAIVDVGDLRMETCPGEQVLPNYHTMIGLAPNESSSLLTVKYSKGSTVALSGLDDADKIKCDACAEVELSPMRFVFIQAQMMTLIDYLTGGILGALTAKVASTAAAAAVEVAKAVDGEQLYKVRAESFEILVPQAAYEERHLSVNVGELLCQFRSLANSGGGLCSVGLHSMSLACGEGFAMVKDPIDFDLEVVLPPTDSTSPHELAKKIDVNIGGAFFIVTQQQFCQLMATLDGNIGEKDHFFRSDMHENESAIAPDSNNRKSEMLHSGQEKEDEAPGGRMYMTVNIGLTSVELCGKSTDDPLVVATAVKAHVDLKMLPDEEQMIMNMALHQLEATDVRQKSVGSHIHNILKSKNIAGLDDKNQDNIFNLTLVNFTDGSKEIDVNIGSTQVTFLPDVIQDLVDFIKIPPKPSDELSTGSDFQDALSEQMERGLDRAGSVYVDASSDEVIETVLPAFTLPPGVEPEMKTMKITFKSSTCRVVLVDLMNDGKPVSTDRRQSRKSLKQLTETLALQVGVDAKLDFDFDFDTGQLLKSSIEVHGERLEVYTARGEDSLSPVEIMGPVSLSYVGSTSEFEKESVHKLVALSAVQITCSMQNLILLNAILSSAKKPPNDSDESDTLAVKSLTAQEEKQIDKLNELLNNPASGQSLVMRKQESEASLKASFSSSSRASSMTAPKQVTRITATFSEISLLAINDLQGLDQALFKLTMLNFIAGGNLEVPINEEGLADKSKASFDGHIHSSFAADYFDSASNMWEALLLRPWEWTVQAKRKKGAKLSNKTRPMSTSVELDSEPCLLRFSEQFIVSIGATDNMWSIYKASEEDTKRSLITSLPYGIDNQTGLPIYFKPAYGDEFVVQRCESGSTEYFNFAHHRGNGFGGKRLYGQDVLQPKKLHLSVGESDLDGKSETTIVIDHIDQELNKWHSHSIGDGRVIFSEVVKTTKATVVRLRSRIFLRNCTGLPFSIAVQNSSGISDVGVCGKHMRFRRSSLMKDPQIASPGSNKKSRNAIEWPSFGVPMDCLRTYDVSSSINAGLTLLVSPHLSKSDPKPNAAATFVDKSTSEMWGVVALPPPYALMEMASGDDSTTSYEIICTTMNVEQGSGETPFVAQAIVEVKLIDFQPFIEIYLQPRLVLENRLPVSIFVRTPMPYTYDSFGNSGDEGGNFEDQSIHCLSTLDTLNIFTPGPAIAVSIKFSDVPVAGGLTNWLQGEWIEIPLSRASGNAGRKSIKENAVSCFLPFIDGQGGNEIFLCEEGHPYCSDASTALIGIPISSRVAARKLCFAAPNTAIDHTGDILLEAYGVEENNIDTSSDQKKSMRLSKQIVRVKCSPWSSFGAPHQRRRLTLLPISSTYIRMVVPERHGNKEIMRRSQPFRIDEVTVGGGGLESTAIIWGDTKSLSGYFIYRQLATNELHIIPEYIVFNGSEHTLTVRYPGEVVTIEPKRFAPVKSNSNTNDSAIMVMVEIPDLGAVTAPTRVDYLGLKFCPLKSTERGMKTVLLGRLAIQTVIGGEDSRWVIKVGDVKVAGMLIEEEKSETIFANDSLRLRVRLSEFQLTLCDTMNRALQDDTAGHDTAKATFEEVVRVVLSGIIFDYQKIFKVDPGNPNLLERSQLAVIVDDMRVIDCDPESLFPIVIDTTVKSSMLDIIVRFRSSLDSDLVKVELFDCNIAYKSGKSEKIVINTSEEFIWRLLDVAHRITTAIASISDVSHSSLKDVIEVEEENEADDDFTEESLPHLPIVAEIGNYKPPQSDKLYELKIARVSPISLLVSFKRLPVKSRYKKVTGVRGAKLMNYFTQSLKFTVDKAGLSFAGYIERDIRGPPDRFIELLSAEYTSRMKYQFLALVKATSFNDWKNLTGRKDGSDEYVEGDAIRSAGHLTGKSVGFALKSASTGLGDGISSITGVIGTGVINASDAIGAGDVGRGVNSVLTGVGDGVGSTVKGVGKGAGKVIKGAGTGVGQIFGGLGGGAVIAAKGIGRGISEGDGKAVLDGLGGGANSVGTGVKKGVTSVATGLGDGVTSVGKGLWSGVRSSWGGVQGAFNGKNEK